jgi:hypothetical protein
VAEGELAQEATLARLTINHCMPVTSSFSVAAFMFATG